MILTLVIHSSDPETAWNAFRLGNTMLGYENDVAVFLLGAGVTCAGQAAEKFDVREQMNIFIEYGGRLFGSEICCNNHLDENPDLKDALPCEWVTLQTLYSLIKDSDRVITL
jgi:sulfur relay (sulfurtransferase) complex TusBCD TusD component (DsrE family)